MRVTKIIREYVEKTVNTRLTFGEPVEKFQEAKKAMDEYRAKAEEDIRKYAECRLEAANRDLPEGFKLYIGSDHSIVRDSYYDAPLAKEAGAHEREIREKRKQAIESILVELELGATKADLERLITEAIA